MYETLKIEELFDYIIATKKQLTEMKLFTGYSLLNLEYRENFRKKMN